jgi:hypothetical protein
MYLSSGAGSRRLETPGRAGVSFTMRRIITRRLAGNAGSDDKRTSDDDKRSGADAGFAKDDLIARLKAAEEEAKELKQKLGQATADGADEGASQSTSSSRIDGADLRRETLSFVESKPRNWLSESDIEFFTGGGPGESVGLQEDDREQRRQQDAVVQRRTLIGVGLSALVGAFALVPTEKLQPAPSKPLFFYLVPLLRVRALLVEASGLLEQGNASEAPAELTAILSRIQGAPNNVQQNLRDAAASLAVADGGDPSASSAATTVGRDVYEYIKGIDYQTYYDRRTSPTGDDQLLEYSRSSAKAAVAKLDEFFRLMPADQLEAARAATAPL